MHSVVALAFLGLLLFAATATGEEYAPGFGPNPQLPEPEHSLVPTVNIAPAKSWPAGATPTAAGGLQVTAFAKDLDHPRWLYVLPNGDVLVAETDAPPRPEEGNGLKAWFMSFFQKRAGSTRTASPNRITLLRDGDGDGDRRDQAPLPDRAQFALRHGARRRCSLRRQHGCADALPYYDGETMISPTGREGRGPAGRAHRSPLDQECHRQRGRQEALCNRWLQQQRGRERPRQGGKPRGDPRDRPGDGQQPHIRVRPAQPQRLGLAAAVKAIVDRRQRARRARQRSRPRLSDRA